MANLGDEIQPFEAAAASDVVPAPLKSVIAPKVLELPILQTDLPVEDFADDADDVRNLQQAINGSASAGGGDDDTAALGGVEGDDDGDDADHHEEDDGALHPDDVFGSG